MASRAFIQGIQGPIGSGKTSCALMKFIHLAIAQRPSTKDGIRYFKACVVHQNYRQLWRSTIPSWWKWMPQDQGEWVGGKDGPATHTIIFKLQGVGKINFVIDYVAIGDNRAEDVLRGYEPTVFLLNEADLLGEDVLTFAIGRAGRFPRQDDGGPSYWGVMLDFNAPEADNYVETRIINPMDEELMEKVRAAFELAVAEMPDSSHIKMDVKVDYFCQPGGFEPGAENLQNLPPGYYFLQMIGQPDWYIQRMINNKTGYSRHGKVVWPEYNDRIHCASEDLEPVPGIPLSLGADAGGTPAGTIGQRMPNGQHRVLDEITTPDDEFTGPTRFGEAFNDLLKERYDGFKIGDATGDPSAAFGGDEDDLAWLRELSKKMKINWRPAPTNALTPRFDVIRKPLGKMIDGTYPAYMISPRCKKLRKAFGNGYFFKKREAGGTTSYAPQPEKNEWSHVAEAEQYRMLGTSSYSAVLGRGKDQDRGRFQQTHAITDDTPAGEVSRLMSGDEDYY